MISSKQFFSVAYLHSPAIDVPWDLIDYSGADATNAEFKYPAKNSNFIVEIKYDENNFERAYDGRTKAGSYTAMGKTEAETMAYKFGGGASDGTSESGSRFTEFDNNTLWSSKS